MNISIGQNYLSKEKKPIWVYSSSPHKWGRNKNYFWICFAEENQKQKSIYISLKTFIFPKQIYINDLTGQLNNKLFLMPMILK